MNASIIERNRLPENNLSRVIEPLASYICSVERPRAALELALEALFQEVERTNRAAAFHFRARVRSR